MSKFVVKHVAVLGAGVMGAQIAAHLANAGVPVTLFDLAAKEGDRNGIVKKALAGLKKLEPAPLAGAARLALIQPANYDDHIERLQGCDLIIEAIAERMDWKTALYERIAPHVAPGAIIASEHLRAVDRRAGPRPARAAAPPLLRHPFLQPAALHAAGRNHRHLAHRTARAGPARNLAHVDAGQGVIRALDTPNFVANRIGVFSILAAMHHTARLGLGFDEVDALTGPKIGRPKSATYRTADVVGLDTLAHVIGTMDKNLADDPWHRYFKQPDGWPR